MTESLAERAARSQWASLEPDLPEAVAEWEDAVGEERARLAERAVELAQPGVPDPRRLARHATAAAVSRAIRTTSRISGAITTGEPLRDPQGYAVDAAVEAFVDQLALGGAASAELARLIRQAGSMFPGVLREEIATRDIRAPRLDSDTVVSIVARATGDSQPGGPLQVVGDRPITGVAVSQLHEARTGEDRQVGVRVRRPRVARDLRADTQLAASGAAAVQAVLPDTGGLGMGPMGFVQLVLRQHLESTDMRYEALNLVELGLVAEDLGVSDVIVARPIPGYTTERTLVAEWHEGVPLTRAEPLENPIAALTGVAALTLESALVHGVFWADPAPEHILVLPDGRLAVVGVGTLGRFSPELRLAGVSLLRSLIAGEPEGLVEAMRLAGAITPETDVAGLTAALGASDLLNPMAILTGGEAGLLGALNETVRIMLAHNVQPPIEVGLLLRTVFSVGELAKVIDPSGTSGLTAALLPLLPRLPEIIAEAEAALSD